ncbi:META domain-containing protein [Nocardioides panacihumi]
MAAMTKRTFAPFVVVLLMLAGTAACGSDASSGTAVTESDLAGATYVSTSVTGHTLVKGTSIKLVFDSGNMAVSAGCNTQTGPYTLAGENLNWKTQPASTMMACAEDLSAQDDWLRALFISGVATTIDGTKMTMVKADVTIELSKES